MGEKVETLRVVVASPSDVKPERDALKNIIEDVNHDIALDRKVRLEISRWEDDAYAGFHVAGPQGLIDAILRIPECDIFLGIFWKRFGTPTTEGTTGTEHEFQLAYETWKQTRRPQIMVYFNQKAATPKTPEEADQWKQVLQFQQQFPKDGLWWPYRGKAQFEKLVRRHITNWLRQRASVLATESPSVSTPRTDATPAAPLSPALQKSLREGYLNWLMEQVRAVPLSGVDRKSISEEDRRDLDLAAVYTALMTQQHMVNVVHKRRPRGDGKTYFLPGWNLSALAVLDANARLVLLGDPGSGKTTFVNFLALCMAGELLQRKEANLKVLRKPMPKGESEKKEPQLQPWRHGALLPSL
ncbi:MAG: DUF4062 domain-containing protein [Candidatus Binatia bacterium]